MNKRRCSALLGSLFYLSPANFNGNNDNAFNVNNNGNVNNNNVNNDNNSLRPAISVRHITGYLITQCAIVERCPPETSIFPWFNA